MNFSCPRLQHHSTQNAVAFSEPHYYGTAHKLLVSSVASPESMHSRKNLSDTPHSLGCWVLGRNALRSHDCTRVPTFTALPWAALTYLHGHDHSDQCALLLARLSCASVLLPVEWACADYPPLCLPGIRTRPARQALECAAPVARMP